MELEDVINYLLLVADNNKPFVNYNNPCVALWYKIAESPCALATNNYPKPVPKSLFH